MKQRAPLTLAATAFALLAHTAQAVVIWSDDFSTSRASAPNPYDFPGGAAGDDYSVANGTGNTVSVGGGVLNVLDASANQTVIRVFASQFSQTTFSAGTVFTISADLRVNAFAAAAGNSVARLGIFDGSATGGAEILTIGFGYAAFGGVTNTLGFYHTTGSSNAVSTSNGIGIGQPGFTFGTYDGTTAANNDTNPIGSGDDSFYRISLRLVQGEIEMTGSITQLDASGMPTANVANFSRSMAAALSWTGSSTLEGFNLQSGQGGTGNFDWDNIGVDAVPEPSTVILGAVSGFGLLGLLRRRRWMP